MKPKAAPRNARLSEIFTPIQSDSIDDLLDRLEEQFRGAVMGNRGAASKSQLRDRIQSIDEILVEFKKACR